MKVIEKTKDLCWIWQGKPIRINTMNNGQLKSIKSILLKSERVYWFNLHKDYWINSIDKILEAKSISDTIVENLKTSNKISISNFKIK